MLNIVQNHSLSSFKYLACSQIYYFEITSMHTWSNMPEGYQVSAGGRLKAKAEVESFEERVQIVMVVDEGDKELGHGKQVKQSNWLYEGFWQH